MSSSTSSMNTHCAHDMHADCCCMRGRGAGSAARRIDMSGTRPRGGLPSRRATPRRRWASTNARGRRNGSIACTRRVIFPDGAVGVPGVKAPVGPAPRSRFSQVWISSPRPPGHRRRIAAAGRESCLLPAALTWGAADTLQVRYSVRSSDGGEDVSRAVVEHWSGWRVVVTLAGGAVTQRADAVRLAHCSSASAVALARMPRCTRFRGAACFVEQTRHHPFTVGEAGSRVRIFHHRPAGKSAQSWECSALTCPQPIAGLDPL